MRDSERRVSSRLAAPFLGLRALDEGWVLLGGQGAGHLAISDRNVAMVFQNLALSSVCRP